MVACRLIAVCLVSVLIPFRNKNVDCEENIRDEEDDIRLVIRGFWLSMEKILKEHQTRLSSLEASQTAMVDSITQLHNKLSAVNGHQDQLASLEVSQDAEANSIRQPDVQLPECVGSDQLEAFKNIFATDECGDGSHNCSPSATCTDSLFHYNCQCLPGYSGDGFTCQDIDECASGVHECDSHATCTNNPGSYKCKCNPSYGGDGRTCDPLCESPSVRIAGLGCITPVKAPLTWSDARDKCQNSGKILIENIRKEHLDHLSQHFFQLLNYHPSPWVGIQKKKWFSTGNAVARDLWPDEELTEADDECGHLWLDPANLGLWNGKCSEEAFALCQLPY